MKKESNNGQAKAWTPDFVAIGKAYGAGRDSSDEGSIRAAESHGRSVLDKARDYWNLQQWRDKKIKPCPRCGSPYCSIKCHVCAIINRVAKGWYVGAGREKFTPEWLASHALAIKEEKAARKIAAKAKKSNAAKRWRAANPDKAKAAGCKYRANNPESHRIARQNRRARKLNDGGRLSRGLSQKLFKLQNGKCPCCNKPLGNDYHMDHIMPLALGGSNTDGNMQLLRQRCNNQKHAKHPIDFMQSRGFLL